jgi:metal-sulfur cluster biosynthetic enzyme
MTALRQRVLDALGTVYDPELDEPITTLRFVSSLRVDPDGDVEVMLRLPTPQCAPNFAFLMAADARRAVRRLTGVRSVVVRLEDHYTGEEINDALNRGEGFSGAFPGETDDDSLEGLRLLFTRKALIARQSHVCEGLLRDGEGGGGGGDGGVVSRFEDLAARRVRDLPESAEARRCLELRAQLGLDCDPDAPAFVQPTGEAVSAADMQRWLRMGRLVRTSLEANGGICRSLLQFRHQLAADPEEVAR